MSLQWRLLELLIPVHSWLFLQAHGVPQLLAVAALIAVIGALAIAIVARGVRETAGIVAVVDVPGGAEPVRAWHWTRTIGTAAPVGGAGPRAPGSVRSLHPSAALAAD